MASELPRFEYRRMDTAGAQINVAIRGKGAPLLLLHGCPETHRRWHKVAPALARETLIGHEPDETLRALQAFFRA